MRICAFLIQAATAGARLYDLLWGAVFGFAALNILGLIAKRFEPGRKRMSLGEILASFDLTCPCCGAQLKVDPESEAVISHVAPVKPKMFNDMEEAARAMKEQDSRRDSIFRQSIEAQKHASDLLEKKFQEAVRKAKESPDTGRPIRDFDLD